MSKLSSLPVLCRDAMSTVHYPSDWDDKKSPPIDASKRLLVYRLILQTHQSVQCTTVVMIRKSGDRQNLNQVKYK